MPRVDVPVLGILSKEGDKQISVCCQESCPFRHREGGGGGSSLMKTKFVQEPLLVLLYLSAYRHYV